MRISDRIAELLHKHDIEHVFMVTGGGAMHLNDGLSRNKNLKIINLHNEQSCSMAADGYARLNGKPSCVNVTTGPGGINAINGVYGAFTDSIPMIVISGQVKRETLNYQNSKLRQLGDQENNIVYMVNKITKFSYILKNPDYLDNVFEYAIKLSNSGRPGPVWIDIPIDIQGALYDRKKQKQLKQLKEIKSKTYTENKLNQDVSLLAQKIKKAKRPAIIVGGGIRASNSHEEFLTFIEKTNIPVLTAWNAHDVLYNYHKNYAGRPGTIGDRPGNFVVENCDLLIIFGSRLNIRQIGYNFKDFSKNSFKIMVDVDKEELNKKTLNIDMKLNYDLKDFLNTLNKKNYTFDSKEHKEYLKWTKSLLERFPIFDSTKISKNKINPYHFIDELFKSLKENQVVVTSDGTAVVTTFQGAVLKPGQRLFSNSGSASMGFGLPAALGACIANNYKDTICIEGDGSIQMNIQELASVKYHNLPLKIFIFSNEGYHSIRQTQSKYFPDNIIGCGPESGLIFPDFKHISKAYGLSYEIIDNKQSLSSKIKKVLKSEVPIICEIILDKNQEFEPKASAKLYDDGRMKSAPLYDLYPFLDESEIKDIINYNTSKK